MSQRGEMRAERQPSASDALFTPHQQQRLNLQSNVCLTAGMLINQQLAWKKCLERRERVRNQVSGSLVSIRIPMNSIITFGNYIQEAAAHKNGIIATGEF